MTFDEWNRKATKELCAQEGPDEARNIRKARSDGLARFTLWDDYVQACTEMGIEPEADPATSLRTATE